MELTTINNSIKEVREFFNDIRGSLSREEINRIRKELYKKEAVYNSLKEKDSLTNKQKNAGADSGLVKLVVMTNVFFNNQQHKIKIKRFVSVKEITSSFFSNS